MYVYVYILLYVYASYYMCLQHTLYVYTIYYTHFVAYQLPIFPLFPPYFPLTYRQVSAQVSSASRRPVPADLYYIQWSGEE